MLALLAAVGCAIAVAACLYAFRPRRLKYCSAEDHQLRLDHVIASLRQRPQGSKLSLHRRTLQSNTIRNSSHKSEPEFFPVDLSSFDKVIEINVKEGYVICEPSVPFSDLLRELLRHGATTLVVVELPGITVGGAIAGGGLESSSFRHGQFSDSILELECLTPELHDCSPTEDADLFYAVSASYNTVALLTKVKLRIQEAPKYLSLQAERYTTFTEAVHSLQQQDKGDCLEGIAYSKDDIVVIRGTHTDVCAPHRLRRFSRHFDRWYYKTIRDAQELTIPYWDYCFRYDYGAFWMAEYVLDMLGGDTVLTRFLFGAFLDTKHLFAVLHSAKLTDLGRMRVIQDCYVPKDRVVGFLEEIDKHIGIYPIWLCPIKSTQTPQRLACHYNTTDLINVGIYGRPRIFPFDAFEINDRLVRLLIENNARSMLYAQTWHTPQDFKVMYGSALLEIDKVKLKYGSNCFYELYQKVRLTDKEREELSVPIIGTETEALKRVVRSILLSKLGLV
ncbi:hypothetical protein BCR39DRAFT_544138 [Naematelia encephala]|uniref:Delta(24)-sterol reductase n=1 Tax=Naematelia encephala TaxID=71784 RepID=A0A1Y2ASC8_9TREE|nr:hypothetical protein BCR39DRAFT_544138 [Naematelia encephala]